MNRTDPRAFRVWSGVLPDGAKLSARQVIELISESGALPEAQIHSGEPNACPRVYIEFHGSAGFTILVLPTPKATGKLAAYNSLRAGSRLSPPSVFVCLGGQVIEQWPRELFQKKTAAVRIVSHFLRTGTCEPSFRWVGLSRFGRSTVHPGGKDLLSTWKQLQARPRFPFSS